MTQHSFNIVRRFVEAAEAAPGDTALIHGERTTSYGVLLAGVRTRAAHFTAAGIGPGYRILVFVPMSVELYSTVLALFWIGACPVFLDEWVSLDRLRACLQTVPCAGLIAGRRHLLLSLLVPALRRLRIRLHAGAQLRERTPVPVCGVASDQTALVTFTTGSTGVPKAADRTHGFLQAQLDALDPLLRDVESPCLTTLPIVVLLHLARGRAALLPPPGFRASKPATLSKLLAALNRWQPRSLILSPAILGQVLESTAPTGRVRRVLTGGGPVYPDLAAQVVRSFPEAHITAVYGSTEAEPISHIEASELAATRMPEMLELGLPAGMPDASVSVHILDADSKSQDLRTEAELAAKLLPAGAVGEIIVSGEHVLRNYINNPEAEAATKIRIGGVTWHRTGDCGRIGDDGRLYLLGRVSEIVCWEGRRLYPAVLSYVLKLEAQIGIAGMLRLGDQLVLVLERADKTASAAALHTLAQAGIAGVQCRFVKHIPRDPRHRTKVDYPSLLHMLG